MSYAIGFVVYGISFKNAPLKFNDDIELIREADLAISRYSGSGDRPLFIGSDKFSITECDDVSFSQFKNCQISPADQKKFEDQKQKLLDEPELTQEFKDWLSGLNPDLFITWGSS